ncbi:hypothetical protein V8C26DRAFT_401058 [Trichoderma gracile]
MAASPCETARKPRLRNNLLNQLKSHPSHRPPPPQREPDGTCLLRASQWISQRPTFAVPDLLAVAIGDGDGDGDDDLGIALSFLTFYCTPLSRLFPSKVGVCRVLRVCCLSLPTKDPAFDVKKAYFRTLSLGSKAVAFRCRAHMIVSARRANGSSGTSRLG